MKRLLIVEDEEHLATGLRFNLEAEGCWAWVRCRRNIDARQDTLGSCSYINSIC